MLTPRLLSVASMLTLAAVSGCAVSIGGPGHERTVCGLCYVGRATNGVTTTVTQHVMGVDLRVGTTNDGATLGYSGLTTAFPGDATTPPPAIGFRWPLGFAWGDPSEGVIHELGWIVTRIPESGDVVLTHDRRLGAGGMFSRRGPGVVLGYRDRLTVTAPPDDDAIYVVRYESDKPLEAVFTADYGGS